MAYRRTAPAGLIPLGFQVISLANSTAGTLNSTCAAGSAFHISVETQAGRYRADSTAPTMTTGVLLPASAQYWLDGVRGSALKFQRSTGTCKISVMAYKRPGE